MRTECPGLCTHCGPNSYLQLDVPVLVLCDGLNLLQLQQLIGEVLLKVLHVYTAR